MLWNYKSIKERADEVPEYIRHAFNEGMLLARRSGTWLTDDAAYLAEIENSEWYPVALLAYSYEYSRRKQQSDTLQTIRSAMRDLRLID